MASLSSGISETPTHSDAMTGKGLRRLREQLGMSQVQLAPILGLTRSALGNRERRNSVIPTTIAAGLLAIHAARAAGETFSLPRKKNTWRESVSFKITPPFAALPANGIACGCNDPTCGLKPVRDGEWLDNGHLWI